MNAVDPPRSSATNSGEGRDVRSKGPLHARSTATKRPASRRSASRRRRWGRRVLLTVVAAAVLLAGGAIADYYYLGSLIHRTTVHHLQKTTSTENILLVGSTDRCALKVQNKAYGLCSQGVTGINGDIVMVLHLNLTTHAVSLISLPRDTFVPNARTTGANKIDAALYQGPSQLAVAIEEDFAIPISHYVELNFDTFANVVNALGGVRMYFPVPVFDAESGLNIKSPGCYLLDGYHALQVVRARHLQYQVIKGDANHATWPQEALSDIARIRRTHEFLRVLAKGVAARGLSNPVTDQSLAASVLPSLTVDQGFSESQMVSLAKSFATTNVTSVPQVTYPVVGVNTGSYLYQGYYYGDVVFPLQPTGYDTVNSLLQVPVNQNVFTDASLPAPRTIRVSVLNGSAISGQAGNLAAGLTTRGFRVVGTGNVTPDGVENETIVWYGGAPPPANGDWRSPQLADAQAVMHQLQGPAIMGYDPALVTTGADVTVQTGNDVTVAPTTLVTKKNPAGATSGPTTPVYDPPTVKSDTKLAAPTALSQPLAPWDPRSCNAAGTGPGTF